MPTTSPRKNSIPSFAGFIQIDLTEQDIAIIEASTMTSEDAMSWFSHMSRNGYQISVKYDLDDRTTKITAMDVDSSRSSAGWMLSAQAPSLAECVIVMNYKHDARMNGDWRPFCNSAREVKKYR